jgi:hypothetical protein
VALLPKRAARLVLGVTVALGLALAAGAAPGSPAVPPWRAPAGEPPLESVLVEREGELLQGGPSGTSPRRGAAARGALLPYFGSKSGAGCARPWHLVGPSAWVCGEHVALRPEAPLPATAERPPLTDGLPLRYHFVGRDGSFAYRRLDRADLGEPDMQLEPGFSVGVVEERVVGGERYARTHKDLWVPARDLSPARVFLFQGGELTGLSLPASGALPLGWVRVDSAKVRDHRGQLLGGGSARQRFDRVDVLEQKGSLVRISPTEWLKASDVRVPTRAAPPPEIDVGAGERWIDVELSTQTLVAYEGAAPVFATLVSTGKGREGTANATPKGTHRIWIKLATSDMDNLEDPKASRYYRMEDVPWVQYFERGVGLHAAYWHRSFGEVRSHGCVNLAPLDAQRLYTFTSPHQPVGWNAVAPTAYERGAVVRVR